MSENKTIYICPMDPDIVKNEPGSCPKCGMKLVPMNRGNHNEHKEAEEDFQRRFWITLPFVLSTIILSPNIQKWFGFSLSFPGRETVLFLLTTFIVFFGGLPFFKGARGELSKKNPQMMTLVALAIVVGYLFSLSATFFFSGEALFWEISTLISVFLLGHWFEMRAVRGTTQALTELTKLVPQTSHVVRNGEVMEKQTSEVLGGERLLVKPGERIPIDGIVIEGESAVNEAMITGESVPVSKAKGESVVGGTINQDGALTVEVTKIGSETVLSQIIKLVQEAQGSKPEVQKLADRAAGVLFYIALLVGVGAFLIWFLILPQGFVFAATVGVAVVVIACPHALGLAIPTVTTITSTLGAKNGILIKEMKGLEIARKLNFVVFDKTGTLTKGEFKVEEIKKLQTNFSENDLMKLAASLEVKSQHSIAKGIVEEAEKRKIALSKVENFKSYPGKGAVGLVEKRKVVVGNQSLFEELKLDLEKLGGEKGKTPVYLAVDEKVAGVIYLADTLRDESKEAVKKLHEMDIKIAMLTGDTKEVADIIATELSVDKIYAQVLPGEKVEKIKDLQKEGYVVAMVGDGVNDAPSLTQAHVGIAIGAGTDVAVESADIVLMKNDPLDVVKAISLSRKTNSKMVQNLVWATGYNVFAIPLAAGILYPFFGILLRPEWAAILMSASSVIVVFNALLLSKDGENLTA